MVIPGSGTTINYVFLTPNFLTIASNAPVLPFFDVLVSGIVSRWHLNNKRWHQ
jgi:hypothetical protein